MRLCQKTFALLTAVAAAGCGAPGGPPAESAAAAPGAGMCLDDAPGLASIWNDDRRAEVRTAHGADPDADAGEAGDLFLLGELIVARMDELALAFDAAARDACAAHRRGELDDAGLDSAAACLALARTAVSDALPLALRGLPESSTAFVLGLAVGPARRIEGCLAAAVPAGTGPEGAAELIERGRDAAARGDPAGALTFLERADGLYDGAGDRLGREIVALETSHVAAAAGMEDDAVQMIGKAARHCRAAAAESPARREAALAALDAVAAALAATLGGEHPRARAVTAARELCAGDGGR